MHTALFGPLSAVASGPVADGRHDYSSIKGSVLPRQNLYIVRLVVQHMPTEVNDLQTSSDLEIILRTLESLMECVL